MSIVSEGQDNAQTIGKDVISSLHEYIADGPKSILRENGLKTVIALDAASTGDL